MDRIWGDVQPGAYAQKLKSASGGLTSMIAEMRRAVIHQSTCIALHCIALHAVRCTPGTRLVGFRADVETNCYAPCRR